MGSDSRQAAKMIDERKYDEALALIRSAGLSRADVCRVLNIRYDKLTYFLRSRHPELVNKHDGNKGRGVIKREKTEADKTYRKALKMCRQSMLSYKEIAEATGVTEAGLKAYIQRYHRDVMMQRQGIQVSKLQASTLKFREREGGQTLISREKYDAAIRACDSLEYLKLTVAEIAREFEVPENGLLKQLRDHFPEIVERREMARRQSGIVDNRPRGKRKISEQQYSKAIDLLKHTEKTISEVALECGVTYTGLRSYLLSYHRDVVEIRREKRSRRELENMLEKGPWDSSISALSREQTTRYDVAIEKLKNGEGDSVEAIAREMGFVPESLRAHLKKYEPELYERYGYLQTKNGRKVLARTAEKYDAAVKELERSGKSIKEIAEEFGLVYNSFSAYIRRLRSSSTSL